MENSEIWAKKTVCIIDDNDDIREIYRTKFIMEGFEVSTAVNGVEGLKVIREKNPDIILLDIEMPVMNGLEVLAELKKDSTLIKIPVVMLTNQDNEGIFKEVGKFNTRFYIIKSLATPQKVVDLVREAL
ncbi:MAG: response regulator [Candidatus Moraniibacteriota bacterium]